MLVYMYSYPTPWGCKVVKLLDRFLFQSLSLDKSRHFYMDTEHEKWIVSEHYFAENVLTK